MPAAAGDRLTGWVRSFRGSWGFINALGYDGDLFVGLKGNPHLSGLSEDDEVEFEIKVDDKGKAEAINVVVTGQKNAFPAPVGSRFKGRIRSFTGGWGFLTSPAFPGDLYVGLRSNPHLDSLAVGDEVEFEIKAYGSGKHEAVRVELENCSPYLRSLGDPAAPAPSEAPAVPTTGASRAERASVAHLVGQTLCGRIKSFQDPWGFVNSDSFPGDLFVHAKSNPALGPVSAGDPVQFCVEPDPNSGTGEHHAVCVVPLRDDVHCLVGQTVRGWVKSFKEGWGLLNSNRFEGDIFVGLRANPQIGLSGLPPGRGVEFQIATDEKSTTGVQAVRVKLLAEGFQPGQPIQPISAVTQTGAIQPVLQPGGSIVPKPTPDVLMGQRVQGVVRSFRESWGFVISDDFEGDLFLHQGSNPGMGALTPGDAVIFDISMGGNGKCHATRVQPIPTELKDLVGRSCSGRVRSFSENWGFATSQKFSGDLFVGLRSNPQLAGTPLAPGDVIEFIVQRSSGNRSQTGYEAVAVAKVDAPAVPTTAAHVAPLHRSPLRGEGARSRSPRPLAGCDAAALGSRSPAAMLDCVLTGWVRSFRGSWGFAQSDAFDGDLFLGTKSNGHLPREPAAGDQIQFRIAQGSGGKLEAVDVCFVA